MKKLMIILLSISIFGHSTNFNLLSNDASVSNNSISSYCDRFPHQSES